jgi:hypothetical protein
VILKLFHLKKAQNRERRRLNHDFEKIWRGSNPMLYIDPYIQR